MARQAHGTVRVRRMDITDKNGKNPVRTIPAKMWHDPSDTNPFKKTIQGTKDPIFVLVDGAKPAPEPVEAKATKGRKKQVAEQEVDTTEEEDNVDTD